MKKVLFFAVAALAYVGATNAQYTVTPVGAGTVAVDMPAIPTVGIVSVGPADTTGTKVIAYGADIAAITDIRMTTGGEYDFHIWGTNWADNNFLGTDWANVIDGSRLYFESDNDGVLTPANQLAVSSVPDGTVAHAELALNDYSITADGFLSIYEEMYDADGNAISCLYSNPTALTVVALPTIDFTRQKAAYCQSEAKIAVDVAVTIPASANTDYAYYFSASLTRTGAGVTNEDRLSGDDFFTFDAQQAAGLATPEWDLTNYCGATTALLPGTYTLTVKQVWDEVSILAGNRTQVDETSGVGHYVDGAAASKETDVTYFSVLPTPQPTLRTNAAVTDL
jgi:hypothetical protein